MESKRWRIEYTRKAEKSLRKLDKPVLRRIRKDTDEVVDFGHRSDVYDE